MKKDEELEEQTDRLEAVLIEIVTKLERLESRLAAILDVVDDLREDVRCILNEKI